MQIKNGWLIVNDNDRQSIDSANNTINKTRLRSFSTTATLRHRHFQFLHHSPFMYTIKIPLQGYRPAMPSNHPLSIYHHSPIVQPPKIHFYAPIASVYIVKAIGGTEHN